MRASLRNRVRRIERVAPASRVATLDLEFEERLHRVYGPPGELFVAPDRASSVAEDRALLDAVYAAPDPGAGALPVR